MDSLAFPDSKAQAIMTQFGLTVKSFQHPELLDITSTYPSRNVTDHIGLTDPPRSPRIRPLASHSNIGWLQFANVLDFPLPYFSISLLLLHQLHSSSSFFFGPRAPPYCYDHATPPLRRMSSHETRTEGLRTPPIRQLWYARGYVYPPIADYHNRSVLLHWRVSKATDTASLGGRSAGPSPAMEWYPEELLENSP